MFDPSEDILYIKDLHSIIDLILNLLKDTDEADVLTFLSYSMVSNLRESQMCLDYY